MTAGIETREALLPADAAGWRLDRAAAVAIPTLSREQIKRLIAAGRAELAGIPARDPATRVQGGEHLRLAVPRPTPAANTAQPIPLVVAYEDEHLLVVDKPAGLVVHPACGNPDGTLVNALLHHCRGSLSGIGGVERPGIVHRIDKDTSGLLVVAKTDCAHTGLAEQFARHSIERRYLALVTGRPRLDAGRIEARLGRSTGDRKKMAVVTPPHGKSAVTHWRVLTPLIGAALVECRLETGRTHQVRVHLAHIGHSLLGDPVYGRDRSGAMRTLLAALAFKRQALHAARLGFVHPVTGETLAFDSAMPDDMQALFTRLELE